MEHDELFQDKYRIKSARLENWDYSMPGGYFASLRPGENNRFGPQSRNLASIVRGYKIGVTKWANGHEINFHWQERFYDRIIRDEKALNAIRRYIRDNPRQWACDRNNLST